MQDVVEEPAETVEEHLSLDNIGERGEGANLLSAEELGAAIAGKHLTPDQETVNASIEAMRPSESLLGDAELQNLTQKLVQSFNAQQLAAYLVRAVGSQTSHTGRRKDRAEGWSWRPGTTPLDQRLDVISIRKEPGNSKSGLVRQILRQAWGIVAKTESVGELELDFAKAEWKMAMLFNSHSEEGVANHLSYLGSQLLARKTTISPFWPSSIVRIAGRREDAEEAARRIVSRLAEIEVTTVDLSPFRTSFLQVPWKFDPAKPMREIDLEVIAKSTHTLVVQSHMTLRIYSQDDASRSNAMRLAISLLDLPSPKTTQMLGEDTLGLEKAAQKLVRAMHQDAELVEFPVTGVHQRLREMVLYRLTKPLSRSSKASRESQPLVADQARLQSLSCWLKKQYDQIPSRPYLSLDKSAWNLDSKTLTVTYCNLLQTSKDARESRRALIPHHQPPGLAQLLTCFDIHSRKKTNLTVRLMPATGRRTKDQSFPRFSLSMGFDLGGSKPVPQYPEATVDVHETIVPLPASAVDAVFTSSTTLRSQTLFMEPRFRAFVEHIQDSVTSGSGTLSGQPSLDIPRSLAYMNPSAKNKSSSEGGTKSDEADVTYLLEQFEQTQRVRFVPGEASQLDPLLSLEARELLAAWPKNAVLEVLMVDAGAFGGRRTEVKLIQADHLPKEQTLEELQQKSATDGQLEADLLDFFEGAFVVPKLMTLASSGMLYRSEGPVQAEGGKAEAREDDLVQMAKEEI